MKYGVTTTRLELAITLNQDRSSENLVTKREITEPRMNCQLDLMIERWAFHPLSRRPKLTWDLELSGLVKSGLERQRTGVIDLA